MLADDTQNLDDLQSDPVSPTFAWGNFMGYQILNLMNTAPKIDTGIFKEI